MNHLFVAACAIAALVLWAGRRLRFAGARRLVLPAVRLAACGLVLAALSGLSCRRQSEVPRRVLYLVDGSLSIDQAQRAWIARRISALEEQRPARLERAVAVFADRAEMVVPFGTTALPPPAALARQLAEHQLDRRQTNFEAALLAVPHWTALPRATRIVLFSDGRETAGNVSAVLGALRSMGLEVYTVALPVAAAAATVWEQLIIPSSVQQGLPVPVQAVVFHAGDKTVAGAFSVGVQGVSLRSKRVVIQPGWQVLQLSVPSLGTGMLSLDVELSVPAAHLKERRQAYLEISGPPRVLMLTDQPTALPALAQALERNKLEVTLARPADLPASPESLAAYDAVLLFNVAKSVFSPAQVEALRGYLAQGGGGLLSIGLGGDLAHEVTTPAALDDLLPVTLQAKGLKEAKRRICVIMLIDRSASMIGPRIAATKRAAVALVKQLQPEDLVGILAFDTQPYVIAEVQPAAQLGPELVEKLVKLRSSGGTDIFPALTAAGNRLDLTGATLKHIILLSDGNTPLQQRGYQALIESFRLSGTTISTIGIGSAFVNTDFLIWLSQATRGTFYQMRNLDELPQLVARDMQQAMSRLPFAEGLYRPLKTPDAEWFSEIEAWPSLHGYITAELKPTSRVELTVQGSDGPEPLLARSVVDQGRVAWFASDADMRWSPEWIRWPGFDDAWLQVLQWVLRPRLNEELFVWTDTQDAAPALMLEGTLHQPRAELKAAAASGRVSDAPGMPLSLAQVGAWRWQASLAQVPSGWYQLLLASEVNGTTVYATRWIQVGTPPSLLEQPGQPPQETTLRQVAHATGGFYGAPDAAFLPPTATTTVQQPLLRLWLPLMILLLLLDAALRGNSML